jgi:RES domain-containing protein
LRFVGVAYRAHDPRWSFLPTSGAGAAIHGGRFNPRGIPALYLALDPLTAVRESNQGFSSKINPCLLCAYDVDCDDVVDLSTESSRTAEGVGDDELAAPWLAIALAGGQPPQWRLFGALHGRGAAGVVVRSFAPGSSASDNNLVLWRWGADSPHKVAVFDPAGRLPKNPLSWR